MRYKVILGCLAFTVYSIVLISAQESSAKQAPPLIPTLSEVSSLKAELFKTKIQLTQCRVDLLDSNSKLASSNLTSEQSQLEQAFRKELKCSATDTFDWNTLHCNANAKKDPSIK